MADRVRIIAAGDTHIGQREHNEDAILVRRELDLYCLADGAGGENAGNVASSMALASIAHRFEATHELEHEVFDVLGVPTAARRLSAAVHRANADIVQLARESDRYRGMGTTVVATYVERDRGVLHLAHVGDSRCYRLRAGMVELLTQDHSLANDVLELAPELEDERARELPTRVVTRALGMAKTVRVAVQSVALAHGDRYLLCSDGLTDQLEEEQIADALRQQLKPEALVKLLFEIAHAEKARDNLAVIVLDVQALGDNDWPTPSLRARPEARRDRDAPEIVIIRRDSAPPPAGPDADAETDEGLEDVGDDDEDDEPELEISGGGISSIPPKKKKKSKPAPPPPVAAEAKERSSLPEVFDPLDEQPTSEFPAVHLVPADPEKAKGLQVLLHDLPEPRDERDPTIRFRRKCPSCDAVFDGPKDVCPFCWKAV